MKIIGWGHYDYDNEDGSQKQYVAKQDPNPQETYMNLCEDIRKNKYWFDGEYHQNGKMGTPIVEDGSFITHSWRSWGGVMADAWSCVDHEDYNYMDFYMLDHYDDRFRTPEYDLPGFVKPERPITTKPTTHLTDMSIRIAFKKTLAICKELFGKFEQFDSDNLIENETLCNTYIEDITTLKSEIEMFLKKIAERKQISEEFYSEHPEFDPSKIVTLKSEDGRTIRVFGDYANETYESIFEKYPFSGTKPNTLRRVFPDYNLMLEDSVGAIL